ncbi:MAG TPA: Hsp20/alpha crystallin family protein [Pyrinomonadaceae bacterium]
MARSIERYLRTLPKTHGIRYTEQVWNPPADVYRTHNGEWVVKVELAGVDVNEIEIDAEGDALSIIGSRRDSMCTESLLCHQLEIVYSHFEKTIRFPCSVERAKRQTLYQDGLLIIRLRFADDERCG